jgi:inner membrane protein
VKPGTTVRRFPAQQKGIAGTPLSASPKTSLERSVMSIHEILSSIVHRIGRSLTVKLITIGILIMVLLIPVSMVQSLIREREWRQEQVVDEINGKWGGTQTVAGPILTIPYSQTLLNEKKMPVQVTRYLHLLPDTLIVDGSVAPQVRYRGIFQAVLYGSQLSITGHFQHPTIDAERLTASRIHWDRAFMAIGISDMRGIRDGIAGRFGNRPLVVEPGVETDDVLASGVSAAVALDDADSGYDFQLELHLNGSQALNFIPVGRESRVSIQSDWPDPSFSGAFLPVERKVSDTGFTARWNVLHLNRNFPQSWTGDGHAIQDAAFGVRLYTPVDVYQKSMRTAKYALMFIVFAFMAFFLSEVMARQRVHPVQYLLVGLAIIIFYALLLSISEQASFGLAYLVAAAAVVSLITAYTRAILGRGLAAVMVGGILTVLYGYLYILLQLTDYALLLGSIGLFITLALVMFLTRRIDWYGLHVSERQPAMPAVQP